VINYLPNITSTWGPTAMVNGYVAPYNSDRNVRAMDRVFEAIRDYRVTELDTISGIEYRIDGNIATESYIKAIKSHLSRGYIYSYELAPGIRQLSI